MWVEKGKAGWNILTQGHKASLGTAETRRLGPGVGRVSLFCHVSDEEVASSDLVKIYLPNWRLRTYLSNSFISCHNFKYLDM